MDEKTWEKYEDSMEKIPELKTHNEIWWYEEKKGTPDNLRTLCELLKVNAIPAKHLRMDRDEIEEETRLMNA